MKLEDIRSIRWSDYSQDYIIDHPLLSPILADPTFTFPEDSPDGRWHLFAHSIWGIHHFLSPDGVKWKDSGVAIANGMRPFLYHEAGVHYLFYERYRPLSIIMSAVKSWKWYSEIAVSRSTDLKRWSPPKSLVKPLLEWHRSGDNRSVSNPCLVKRDARYFLYYSASLVLIPDCGFNEPDSIALATAAHPEGPYELMIKPVIEVDKGDPWRNLSSGSLKAIVCDDGLAGFENGIYWDEAKKQSGSAIIVLKSQDGIKWERLLQEPVLKPTTGWRSSHVYACDVRYRRSEGKWYMYYNARNGWPVSEGQERIGLLLGTNRQT
ncbi:MAG: family 43 glycosylhydrolase [Dehalococcoidia bacterium]|jgi:predicted GH43/DUF377 family glycosyl hydrolase